MVVGEFSQETHLLVIGGGPAGYAAAFRAAQLGVQTTIVDDRDALGGACLHAGCVPSKTLAAIAETIRSARHAASYGVTFAEPAIDLDAVRAWITGAVDRLGSALDGQAQRLGIERIAGRAKLTDDRTVSVAGAETPRVRFRRAIVATGARPAAHATIPSDHPAVMTPEEAVRLPSLPERLLVVGSGYMAVELASIYAALGSKVTLASEHTGILPQADADLLRPLTRRLGEQLEFLRTTIAVTAAADAGGALEVTLLPPGSRQVTTRFDGVIVAIGCAPGTSGLGLDATRVETDASGFISVDRSMRTSDQRILAAGDVTGGPLLAHVALAQGRVAGEVVAGRESVFDARAVPQVVFSDPPVAWCGLTEQQAKADGEPYRVAKVAWGASGRATGMGRTDGMTKVIYDPETSIVLGVGICGHQAVEMIGEAALAIEMGAELADLADTLHAHPTMHELLADAARGADAAP